MAETAIDPGNEVSKLKPHSTEWVIALLRKHPEATLARGEGGLLIAEIDRLQEELRRERGLWTSHQGRASDWDTGVGGAGR